ncbi:hypothetical protein C4571_02275 [Candidatus Parcubacteria bacterium]|nr:MAG: hypothetical protein C4571_02275 [Candidatus Parcubacteria bacterium]
MRHYWFKPKRFWKWFAAYYPVSKEGWAVSIVLGAAFLGVFCYVDARSHSASDTFYGVALPWIIVLLIFDIVSFRTGEYPGWWKRRGGRGTDGIQ